MGRPSITLTGVTRHVSDRPHPVGPRQRNKFLKKFDRKKNVSSPIPVGNGLVSHNVMPAHARCCEPARKITKIANAEFSARSHDSIESTDLETPGEIEPRTNISSADASKDARRISYTLRFHVLAFPSSFFDFCRDAFEFMNTVR